MNKPKPQKRPNHSNGSLLGFSKLSVREQYQLLFDRTLNDDEVAEMEFNLLNYVKLLIQMDVQHIEWLKQQAEDLESQN